jgi:hypothetical protein
MGQSRRFRRERYLLRCAIGLFFESVPWLIDGELGLDGESSPTEQPSLAALGALSVQSRRTAAGARTLQQAGVREGEESRRWWLGL